jgi:chorismate mutase/prephenate dehydratase
MSKNEDQSVDPLVQLREKIDSIDADIAKLISARAQCAQEVAEVKKATGQITTHYYRPEREAQVLRKAMAVNQGPLSNEEMARLFREIMSACLALEHPVRAAFLGPEGTFTQQAVLKHFGHSAICIPMATIDDVFREVEAGAVEFGVVPVENSSEGVVNHTLDTFFDSGLKICGEVALRIHQNLLVADITKVDNISRIYSHSQSLAQCRKWLDAHYPKAERIPVNSNADAAKRIKGEWNAAAIAGEMAAGLYDLKVHAEKIEDRPDNSTRFLIIGNQEVPPSGDDKTSLIISMRNEPGALYDLLEPFRTHRVNLTNLETRPSKTGQWNYTFYIDLKGHQNDEPVKAAMLEVGKRASDLKVLGSYPRAVL